ncbi:MAG: iron-containing alcohol dehydrogenase [Spirochaetes bacterium]|nr:iron-containing alcohol dehydrogenase [Spirochaetota bacterium]
MNSFQFYNPTKIFFGNGEISRLGKETAKYGKKALMVETRGTLEKLGINERARQLLEESGVEFIELSGVEPNPRLSSVEKGAEICKKNGLDIIIAIGGGSVIDCAKAIGFAAFDDGDIWDFFTLKRKAKNGLPIGVVSTVAATGSEMNTNCVITNKRTQQKYATHYEFSFPKFAILDPELHKTVPKYLTACGMADTISHVLEGYFDGCENTPLQDRIAEGVILTVIENEGILDDLENLIKRSNLSWAATIALNGLNDAGRGGKFYDAHTIEHEVSAKYDIAHGAGLAIVHPAWLFNLCKKSPEKFVQFAERIFKIKKGIKSDLEVGLEGVEALRNKFKSWGLPITLKEIGVEKSLSSMLAEDSTKSPEGIELDKNEVLVVLESCYAK